MGAKSIISIAILGEAKGIKEAGAEARKSLGEVETKGQSTSKKLAAIGTKLVAGLATVGAAAAGYAIKAGSELQETQDNLRNALERTHQTIDSFGPGLSKLLKQNEKWGHTNAEVNTSLEKLVRAGVPAKKALTDEATAANLAASRHISLASATDIVTKVETGHVSLLGRLGIATKDAEGKTLSQAAALQLLADKYGGAADTAGESFKGKITAAKVAVEDMAAKVGVKLIPILIRLGVDVAGVVSWLTKHKAIMVALGVVVGTVVAGLIIFAGVTKAIEVGTKLWTVAQKAATAAQWLFNVAMSANPVLLVVAGIAALAAGLVIAYKRVGWFHTAVDEVWSFLKRFAADAIGIGKAVARVLFAPLKLELDVFRRLWNDTVGKIAHGQKVGVGPLHVTLPDLRIPKLAKGGIITSPTLALIGEAGPEAVVPLSRGGGFGASNVYITMPPGVDPAAVVRAIKRHARLNGALA